MKSNNAVILMENLGKGIEQRKQHGKTGHSWNKSSKINTRISSKKPGENKGVEKSKTSY